MLLPSLLLAAVPIVQCPGYGGGNGGGGGGGNVDPPAAGGTPTFPGDTVPPGGTAPTATPASPTTPSPTAPTTTPEGPSTPPPSCPAPGAIGRGGGKSPFTPPSVTVAGADASEAWWTWWDMHKLDYLVPHGIERGPTTGASRSTTSSAALLLSTLRTELRPEIRAAVKSGTPVLRSAAHLASARLYGDEAVDDLVAALGDSSMIVRERALLALGVSKSPQALRVLTDIARYGSVEKGGSRVTADARHLAVVGLALSRRLGSPRELDYLVATLSADLERKDRTRVETALCAYAHAAEASSLQRLALERVFDGKASTFVRCRAVESLAARQDVAAYDALLKALEDSNPDIRRSAFLAAGEFGNARITRPLIAACDDEREPLARGLALVSVGRRGGEMARRFLTAEVKKGLKIQRSWAALGLGILARDAAPEEAVAARDVIRQGVLTEKNQALKGAWLLALGLSRDAESAALLRTAAAAESAVETRSAAAYALALLATPEARTALRARLTDDASPFTRGHVAQALGYLGHPADADALRASFEAAGQAYVGLHALGLGVHGTRASLEALVASFRDEGQSMTHRAVALESLQLLLCEDEAFHLNGILRRANFALLTPPLERHRNSLL